MFGAQVVVAEWAALREVVWTESFGGCSAAPRRRRHRDVEGLNCSLAQFRCRWAVRRGSYVGVEDRLGEPARFAFFFNDLFSNIATCFRTRF